MKEGAHSIASTEGPVAAKNAHALAATVGDGGIGNLSIQEHLRGGSPIGVFAGAPLDNQQAGRVRAKTLPSSLATKFGSSLGHDLSGVRVHADAHGIGARAATRGHDIAFAPGEYKPETRGGQELLAHELTHVVQQSHGRATPHASRSTHEHEREADRAARLMLDGRSVAALTPAGDAPQLAPDSSGSSGSYGTSIGPETASGTVAGQRDIPVTVTLPGVRGEKPRKQTLVFHEPVLGGSVVSVYTIPLDKLYASVEQAKEAKKKPEDQRWYLSLRPPGDMPQPALPPAAPSTATALASATPAPPPATAPGSQTVSGKLSPAGPSPGESGFTAFDIDGNSVHLVARSPAFGIATEYYKLAVGAASCTVLITPTGVRLIDAGVRHDGATVDAKMMEYAMKRLHEIIGNRPIEEILITHSHLDHVAILDKIAAEFVIKEISINAIQVVDKAFLERVKDMSANQANANEKLLREKYRQQRQTWEADLKKSGLTPEPAAHEAAFDKWVNDQVVAELATVPRVKVNILAPTGSVVDLANTAELGDLDINPLEAKAKPGEAFAMTEYARTTLLDPTFQEEQRKLEEARRKNPKAQLDMDDRMSSSFVMELPNGTQLVVVPDIRVADISAIQKMLKAELTKLGAGEGLKFRVWDMTHHMQSGFVGTRAKSATGDAPISGKELALKGALPVSKLVQLTDMLSSLTSHAASGVKTVDAVAVSVDPLKVDPALAWILRSCGLQVFTAQNAADLRFIEATTSLGRKVFGTTSAKYGGMGPSDPLLRRTSLALEELRNQHEDLRKQLGEERRDKAAEAKDKKAEVAGERAELMGNRKSLQDVVRRAKQAVEKPGPRQQGIDEQQRKDTLKEAQESLAENQRQVAALDQQVADIKAQGERLAAQVEALKTKIDAIEAARRTYLKKIDKTIGKSAHETDKPSVAPEEGGKSPFQAEEIALKDLVDPVYETVAAKVGTPDVIPTFSETTLIIIGEGAQTDAGKQLEANRMKVEQLRDRIATGDRPLEAHGELIGELGKHIEELKARPDAKDPVVADEIAFYEKQMEASHEVLSTAAQNSMKTVDRDPATGAKIETRIIVEQTAEQAGKGVDPDAAAAAKRGAVMKKGMDVFGRAMGGVMIYQNVVAGADVLDRYAQGKAGAGEAAVGAAKSAYGINLGYRMLTGGHVPMGEFVILSILDITETALRRYNTSQEWNTEVAYSIVRNTVALACNVLGGYIVEAGIATGNPFVVAAGLIVMFLGDPILDALGVKDWLAKLFDWRPDEYIDLEKDLNKLLEKYNVIVGALQFQQLDAKAAADVNVQDPEALRTATQKLIDKRWDLSEREREILDEFHAAYARAREGYAELREIDELRARFLELYSAAHADDDMALGAPMLYQEDLSVEPVPGAYIGAVTFTEVQEKMAADEAQVGPQNPIPVADVEKMEQWTKMQEWVEKAEAWLYLWDYGMLDRDAWQHLSETESALTTMLDNAHYRLDPAAQSTNRMTSLFPDTPAGIEARQAYEAKLRVFDNKLDVLRKRTLAISLRTVETGLLPKDQQDAIYEATHSHRPIDYAYKPEYGDLSRDMSLEDLIGQAVHTIMSYRQLLESSNQALPQGITVEQLYSEDWVIDSYADWAINDDDYSTWLYKLKAAEIAASGLAKRVIDATRSQELDFHTSMQAEMVTTDLRQAIEYRRVEKGWVFVEEAPAVAARIKSAQIAKIAKAIREEVNPLTEQQQRAAKTDELKPFQLGTLSDRLQAINVKVPDDPADYVLGVFAIEDAPSVLVARKDMWENFYSDYGETDEDVTVLPLNAAAIAYFQGPGEHKVPPGTLTEVTLQQMQELLGTKAP